METFIFQTSGKARETGPYMYQVVNRYHTDMLPYASYTLPEIFELIKQIPYRADPRGIEVLQRPRYTLDLSGPGGDCDDKAIVLASWARLNHIPYRFMAVRKKGKPNLHHVYAELYFNGEWVPVDPTYNVNTLGRQYETYVEHVII